MPRKDTPTLEPGRIVLGTTPAAWASKPLVTHLVQLGTPNLGTPCADWGIRHGAHSFLMPATEELTTTFAREFDRQVKDTRGVKVSALAGHVGDGACLGFDLGYAGEQFEGDGIVPVESVHAQQLGLLNDGFRVQEGLYHTQMTSSPEAFNSWVKPHLEQ